MSNPFRVLIVVALVVAIAAVVGFVYVVFVDPGNNGSLNVSAALASFAGTA
ncbi:MAG TPA: hypothetical protein VGC18_07050 [Lacisediminihabitans sp.]|uniref:hypothetical protein n=1 Tax=Lacisediminihabitans sp. TaxID=2787631 RepID=UPI002ED87DD5